MNDKSVEFIVKVVEIVLRDRNVVKDLSEIELLRQVHYIK